MRALILFLSALTLSGCVTPTQTAAPVSAVPANVPVSVVRAIEVTRRMEPVAEALCRGQARRRDCDFEFLVLRDPEAGVNAFQTINPENGRPVIILTVGLIRAVRNDDELAFVIGHEAAHHVAGHIDQQEAAARAGAQLFGADAQQRGGSREEILAAAQRGAVVGSLQFGQSAELEADRLGALITCSAGFDAQLGARFFTYLPDADAQILGSHPSNAARIEAVQQAVAQLC